MGNFSTIPQYCLRLFGSSLTSKAFRWYSSLAPGSIRTWEEMQDAFMSNFFSSERDVSITELASVRQREGEPVEKFIDRWKTLGASCRQLPEEKEQVKMCLNSMETGIAFGLTS
ncbi:retrotransposon gag domain-containing protein, partial [Cobetia crustatorum]